MDAAVGERQKVGTLRQASHGFAGVMVALATLAIVLSLGLLAFAPLGALAQLGVAAAFSGVIAGGLVYAMLGTSASPSASPTSATALILAGLVAQLVRDPQFNLASTEGITVLLAVIACSVVLMGIFQIVLGLSGLGQIARYVPQAVLAGFMNGVALLILFSQVPLLLGLAPMSPLTDLGNLAQAKPLTLMIGLATAVTVWLISWKWPSAPATLLGLVAGTALVAALTNIFPSVHLGHALGAVPEGMVLPNGLLPLADGGAWRLLRDHASAVILTGALLAVIGSLESLLVALAADQLANSRHDPSRELLTLGLSNMVSGVCGGLPLVLSSTRSAMLLQRGAAGRGPALASILTFTVVYAFGGPLLTLLPQIVLAGIMLTIAVALSDRWTHQLLQQLLSGERSPDLKQSLVVVSLVCLVTIVFGFLAAVGLGALLAMLIFIRAMNRSLIRGRFSAAQRPSRRIYGAGQDELLARERRRVVLVELEGALFFGSAERLVDEAESLAPDCRCLVLDLSNVSMVDESGAMALQKLSSQLENRGVALLLAGVSSDNAHGKRLRTYGCFRESLPGGGRADWFPDADRAIEAAEHRLLAEAGIDAPTTVVPLADTSLMRGLSADQLALVKARMHQQHLSAGECLFRQGDPGDKLYVQTQGSISIIGGPAHARRRFVSFSPGVMMGEMAMLDGAGRSADAIADTDAVVWSLTREAFDALVLSDPLLGERLMRNIAIHLSERLRVPK